MSAVKALPLALIAFLAGCEKRPTQAECEAMLEHGIELSIRDKHPHVKPAAIDREKARRRRQPPGRAAIEACSSEVSQKALTCAMVATHIDEYERCLVVAPWGYRL